MSDATFQDYVAAERAQLSANMDHYKEVRREADRMISQIEGELLAVAAYEAAKTGKPVRANGAMNGSQRRSRGSRSGGRREAILNLIPKSPSGLSRGEMIESFGLKGDKSGEMSVSNALTALTKSGEVVREGSKYFLAA